MKIIWTLPNILTLIRIVLIPVFITSILYRKYDYALVFFVVAAVTDKLDGFLAKRLNQRTELGSFLDPLADKFMLVSTFVVFTLYGWVPLWLTITVVSRDIIVITGWLLLYLTANVSEVRPTISGKTAIAAQFVLMCLILVELNYGILSFLMKPVIWLTAGLTIASGIQYVYRGLKVGEERP